jgi:hypothetical protein
VLGLGINCWGIEGDAIIVKSVAFLPKLRILSVNDNPCEGLIRGANEKLMAKVIPTVVDARSDVHATLLRLLDDIEGCIDD